MSVSPFANPLYSRDHELMEMHDLTHRMVNHRKWAEWSRREKLCIMAMLVTGIAVLWLKPEKRALAAVAITGGSLIWRWLSKLRAAKGAEKEKEELLQRQKLLVEECSKAILKSPKNQEIGYPIYYELYLPTPREHRYAAAKEKISKIIREKFLIKNRIFFDDQTLSIYFTYNKEEMKKFTTLYGEGFFHFESENKHLSFYQRSFEDFLLKEWVDPKDHSLVDRWLGHYHFDPTTAEALPLNVLNEKTSAAVMQKIFSNPAASYLIVAEFHHEQASKHFLKNYRAELAVAGYEMIAMEFYSFSQQKDLDRFHWKTWGKAPYPAVLDEGDPHPQGAANRKEVVQALDEVGIRTIGVESCFTLQLKEENIFRVECIDQGAAYALNKERSERHRPLSKNPHGKGKAIIWVSAKHAEGIAYYLGRSQCVILGVKEVESGESLELRGKLKHQEESYATDALLSCEGDY